jgi:DNA-binding CsgD family transcriptional regulator
MSYPSTDGSGTGQGDRQLWLTKREIEVADLIARGLTNEQIAEKLVLTPGTVANHVAHILTKLHVQSRVQIATTVVRQNAAGGADDVLALLQRLQLLRTAEFGEVLQHATDVLTSVFAADKVDAFLYDPAHEILVAQGTSQTRLGVRQHELGLHLQPLSNGGRAAWVFREGQPWHDGQVDRDETELKGVRRDLGVRSTLMVPLHIRGELRGVLQVSSIRAHYFSPAQLQLLQFVAYWVGLVAYEHSAEGDTATR